MREVKIENKLVRAVRKLGGKCFKWTSPGTVGIPDRMVLLPGGSVVFVEVKATDKKPRPIQVRQINMLKELGFKVEVIDSAEGVDKFIEELQAT